MNTEFDAKAVIAVDLCETFRERDLAEEPPRMGLRRVSQRSTASAAATE